MIQALLADFRPFEAADYARFGEEDSERPLIHDKQKGLIVILSTKLVQAVYDNKGYTRDFDDEATALDVALLLIASPKTRTPARYELLLGEPITLG